MVVIVSKCFTKGAETTVLYVAVSYAKKINLKKFQKILLQMSARRAKA
jgi:hypothetical protein